MGRYAYRETDIFHFHNANPKCRNASDCVARAISVALSQDWETTIRELTELGIKRGLVFNEPKCYDAYLESKGWQKMKEPRDKNNKKIRVAQYLKTPGAKGGVILAHVGSHHLTVIVDGVVWDTWDCSLQTMHTYYTNPNAKGPKKEKRRFTL